jgi:GAF domain-containing protein
MRICEGNTAVKDKLHILLGLSADLARERDLRPILAKLTDVTKLLLDADRCSIFLHDEKSDELWTIVAHGIEEIRIPAHAGIAGESFSQSQTISIEDAYKDSRFKQEIDMHTG